MALTEKRKKYLSEYRKNNHEKILQYQRTYMREYFKRPEVRAKQAECMRKQHKNLKEKVYEALGGYKCTKCGYDKDVRALQIDHINGDGAKERKLYRSGSIPYYKHILETDKKNYQILCANCNAIKAYDEKERHPAGGSTGG